MKRETESVKGKCAWWRPLGLGRLIRPIRPMGRRPPPLGGTAVLAVTLCSACLLCAAPAGALGRRPAEPPATTAAPTSRFEGVELMGEDADGTVWQLKAAEGWGREGDRTGTLRGVRARLRRDGHDLVLESQQAAVEEGQTFQFSDGVRMTWGEFTVRVAQAAYLHQQGMITSRSPVELIGPGLRVSGVGLEVEVASGVVRIPDRVRAVLGEEKP